jgi:tryptophanyl-tRNA synthetase
MGTTLSWLERVPTYKDQIENLRGNDLATYGFLGYPLLQAADILIYKAAFVPVGEDQAPHVEITREVARRFNHLYGRGELILPEPATLLTETSKLPGLDGRKMSKSYGNDIAMREEPAEVERKVRRMQTDPDRVRRTDKGNPDRCPVWQFHQVYSDADTQAWVRSGCTTAGIGCLECKQPVIDSIIAEQQPWRARAEAYLGNPKQVQWIVEVGTERARGVARATMRNVRAAIGLNY